MFFYCRSFLFLKKCNTKYSAVLIGNFSVYHSVLAEKLVDINSQKVWSGLKLTQTLTPIVNSDSPRKKSPRKNHHAEIFFTDYRS